MSIETSVCASYVAAAAQGMHASGDEYRFALIRPGAMGSFGVNTTNYSDLGPDEIPDALGYDHGGARVIGPMMEVIGGQVTAMFSDAEWHSASFSAAGGLLYNATKGGLAVLVLAFGGTYIGNGGPFAVPLRRVMQARARGSR